MKRTIVIIGAILLSTKTAKAFDYGEMINRNKVDIGYNAIYSRAEEGHIDRLDRAKKQLARGVEAYRQAHIAVMQADARVRELERQMPSHRAYASDWADGATSIKRMVR
jgi:phosphoribosyl-dephospho-CoA transferase